MCQNEYLWSKGLKLFETLPITRRQILDSSKLKESADDNFKFHENGRKLSKRVENTVGKGEIARYEQFLLFPQCFQKACFPGASKGVTVWEWVNTYGIIINRSKFVTNDLHTSHTLAKKRFNESPQCMYQKNHHISHLVNQSTGHGVTLVLCHAEILQITTHISQHRLIVFLQMHQAPWSQTTFY